MAFIDGTALNVAMPAIQASLRASGSQLLWMANSYLLMLAALILVGGSLGDRFGRKKSFGAGIALFTAASCACGLAPSIGALIAARAVQGLGGALMIPGSLSLITASTTPERRGRAIGTWSAVTTLVTVVGPALGGVLSDLGLWRAVFLINLPLGIAALAALASKVPESRDESISGPIDVTGVLLAIVALAALAYGFIEAPGSRLRQPQGSSLPRGRRLRLSRLCPRRAIARVRHAASEALRLARLLGGERLDPPALWSFERRDLFPFPRPGPGSGLFQDPSGPRLPPLRPRPDPALAPGGSDGRQKGPALLPDPRPRPGRTGIPRPGPAGDHAEARRRIGRASSPE